MDEMRISRASAAATYGKGEATVDERARRISRSSPSAETVLHVTRRVGESGQVAFRLTGRAPNLQFGDYTICVQATKGELAFLPGA
jgi:hypothetical protein